jgi:hypothetical protein
MSVIFVFRYPLPERRASPPGTVVDIRPDGYVAAIRAAS